MAWPPLSLVSSKPTMEQLRRPVTALSLGMEDRDVRLLSLPFVMLLHDRVLKPFFWEMLDTRAKPERSIGTSTRPSSGPRPLLRAGFAVERRCCEASKLRRLPSGKLRS